MILLLLMFASENVKISWKNTPETGSLLLLRGFCFQILYLPVRESLPEASSSRSVLHPPGPGSTQLRSWTQCAKAAKFKTNPGFNNLVISSSREGLRGRGMNWARRRGADLSGYFSPHWRALRVEPHTKQRQGVGRLATDLVALRFPSPPAPNPQASRRPPRPWGSSYQ